MKASHTVTPRTLADCDFQAWADPLDFPAERRSSWCWVDFAIAAMAVATAAAIVGGYLP